VLRETGARGAAQARAGPRAGGARQLRPPGNLRRAPARRRTCVAALAAERPSELNEQRAELIQDLLLPQVLLVQRLLACRRVRLGREPARRAFAEGSGAACARQREPRVGGARALERTRAKSGGAPDRRVSPERATAPPPRLAAYTCTRARVCRPRGAPCLMAMRSAVSAPGRSPSSTRPQARLYATSKLDLGVTRSDAMRAPSSAERPPATLAAMMLVFSSRLSTWRGAGKGGR
jgi:hypothetical protein